MIARLLDRLLARLCVSAVLSRACCRWPDDVDRDVDWRAAKWLRRLLDVAEGGKR